MAEFTKEQLVSWANSLIEETHTDISISRTDAHAESYRAQLALLEIALAALTASMGQEPVAWLMSGGGAKNHVSFDSGNAYADPLREVTPLYAAPQLPQPAVDELLKEHLRLVECMLVDYRGGNSGHAKEWIRHISKSSDKFEEKHSLSPCLWMRSAYRAAMLQGAEPVQGWIPCSERMPEEVGRYWCYVEEQNSLGKSHYQWNCSWNGDRWWVESENGGRVTHWMPLPAAPQQEVK
ncbi:DUF551 domain-containing protein [Leclercia sp.]|uniref:DUF551 domain-containing protein n=1 Tax=Leclercia sp. TaxID=1898428 RepID=UPI002899295C|nr:DUF551 domain-containing protein [Leclercia sp.]